MGKAACATGSQNARAACDSSDEWSGLIAGTSQSGAIQAQAAHKHAQLPYKGITRIAISASGKYLSLVFVEAQQ